MSLKAAIELIVNELPPDILAHVMVGLQSNSDPEYLSVRGFSIGHISNADNFRSILERRAKAAEASAGLASRKWQRARLAFVNEAFAASTSDYIWQAYCVLNTKRLGIINRRRRLWFLIDVARAKVLKHFDPRSVFR